MCTGRWLAAAGTPALLPLVNALVWNSTSCPPGRADSNSNTSSSKRSWAPPHTGLPPTRTQTRPATATPFRITNGAWLERDFQRNAGRPRNGRVEMEVLHRGGLAAQLRLEEVVDVRHLRVEEVEAFDEQPHTLRELVADLAVDDRRLLRLDAGVLDERPRAEVTEPQAAERARPDASRRVDFDTGRDDAVQCTRDEVLAGRYVLEARAREREVEVDVHPRVRVDVVGDLDAHPATRRAVLGAARIADVN